MSFIQVFIITWKAYDQYDPWSNIHSYAIYTLKNEEIYEIILKKIVLFT